MSIRSPFLVFKEFISPLQCEEIIVGNNVRFVNRDKDGNVVPTFFPNTLIEGRLLPDLLDLVIPKLEQYYNVEVDGIKPFTMELYPENYPGNLPVRCENSAYVYRHGSKQWARVNSNDFTAVIFLNDYCDAPPFSTEFEVCGGKLEFPNHGFGFNPTRGALILFPSAPNFVNHTSSILAGELTQIRIQVATVGEYVYDMRNFEGNYQNWFKGD